MTDSSEDESDEEANKMKGMEVSTGSVTSAVAHEQEQDHADQAGSSHSDQRSQPVPISTPISLSSTALRQGWFPLKSIVLICDCDDKLGDSSKMIRTVVRMIYHLK